MLWNGFKAMFHFSNHPGDMYLTNRLKRVNLKNEIREVSTVTFTSVLPASTITELSLAKIIETLTKTYHSIYTLTLGSPSSVVTEISLSETTKTVTILYTTPPTSFLPAPINTQIPHVEKTETATLHSTVTVRELPPASVLEKGPYPEKRETVNSTIYDIRTITLTPAPTTVYPSAPTTLADTGATAAYIAVGGQEFPRDKSG
jgi:hypothetical protein